MKFRRGFVSNSSSSSFIVVFDQAELSVDYLKSVLYHNADSIPYEYNYTHWGDEYVTFSVQQLCEAIVDEMKPIQTDDDWISAFEGLSNYDDKSFPDCPDWIDDKDIREQRWKQYKEDQKAATMKAVERFKSKIPDGQYVFVGEFSDEDGQMYTQLEHGGTFNAVTHKRISNH